MTSRTSLLCIVAIPLFALPAMGDWIPLNKDLAPHTPPVVSLLQEDEGGITVSVEIAGFAVTSLPGGERMYQSLDLLTESATAEPGYPEVPYLARLFAVPGNTGVRVEVLETGNVQTFTGFIPPPARSSWWEGEPEPAYIEDKSAYASTEAYPRVMAELGEPVIFRDLRIVRLAVYPMRYVPAKGEVQVFSSLTVRITYGSGEIINPKTTPVRAIAPSFGALYKSAVMNYQNVLDREHGGMELGRDVILCITPDTFATTFQTYADWRHRAGTYVVVKKFSEIGANSSNPDLIKNYIAQAYASWEYPPTHVLLLGDNGYVPRKQVTYPNWTFANENFFVELEGDDYFPEMMIGRFTHQTVYRLQVLMSKFIRYERQPYTVNTDWFKKGIVCSNNAYESQVSVKRFTATTMLEGGFTSVDTMMSSSPCNYTLSHVTTAINQGRSYLNYRGEAWTSGWQASCYQFSTSDVSALNNGQMLTFVTNIGCGVAMFDAGGGNCFGEEWLELGTPTAPRGAVAFIGPTSNTHTTYNNKLDKGIYVGMFNEGMDTPGQALARGRLYLYNVHGTDPMVEYHFRVYCLLGDPSIHIWKDVPRSVTVTYPQEVSVGYNQVAVMALDSATQTPVAGAQVCIAGDVVYVVGTTDAQGRALIDITPELPDTLALMVRGGRVIPFETTMIARTGAQHLAPAGQPVVADLDGNLDGRVNPNENIRITFTLKNWGTETAGSVQAQLASADTTLVRVVVSGPVSFGNVGPNATVAGEPFQFFVTPACSVGSTVDLSLQISSNAGSWEYIVPVEVVGCRLQIAGSQVDDQGSLNPNFRLDPGETVLLFVNVSNVGEDHAPGVTGILRSDDPYIAIPDSVGTFGTIHVGESSTNSTNYFVVSVSPSCPNEYAARFSLTLLTTGGHYTYTTTRSFSLPVGTLVGTDPTGPDSYGYYAYSSDDSSYAEAPGFNWVEISGTGTEIPRNSNGDFTQTVTLPFIFRYYGVNYTQVRVSSDGWIAFGSGTQTSYTNYPLPRNDNVNCMVAPFWDDLFASAPAETGRLLYYYDAAHHRFIVEWYGVGHWGRPEDRETFQVILLNPVHYPTPTGDGEILFQFLSLSETSSNTVGIEDHTQTIGLQYVYNDAYHPTATLLRDHYAIKFTTKPPTVTATNVSIPVEIQPGWNLISNPVSREDSLNEVRVLYPHSVFDYVFAFDPQNGYTQSSELHTGSGYWAKFPENESNSITGLAILSDTFTVRSGWNLIGSISVFVDTATIGTMPPGLTASPFYGFANGFLPVRYLIPGHGYWYKASADGMLVLGHTSNRLMKTDPAVSSDPLANLSSLTIRTEEGGAQTLYFGRDTDPGIDWSYFALPPLPPEGAFDARFDLPEGGFMVWVHEDKGSDAMPIAVRAGTPSIRVQWNIEEGNYLLSFGTGGTLPLTGEGEEILDGPVDRMVLRLAGKDQLPREYALWQNYPNPFNPTTSVRFALPVVSSVRVDVFNLLGQHISTVVQEERKAGYHTIQWNGADNRGNNVGSGVYFLRLTADGANGAHFTSVRKLVLVK